MKLGRRWRTRAEAEKDYASMWLAILGGAALVPILCSLPATAMMICIGMILGGGLVVAWILEQIFRTGK